MLQEVGTQTLHRKLLLANFPSIDQYPPDTRILSPVGSGVADLAQCSISQAQYTGALDMKKKEGHGIFDPREFVPFPSKRCQAIDLMARKIR